MSANMSADREGIDGLACGMLASMPRQNTRTQDVPCLGRTRASMPSK
jgi:hypothetical protein